MPRSARRRLAELFVVAAAVGMLGAKPFSPGLTFKIRLTMGMPAMPGMNGGDLVVVGHGVAAGGLSRLDVDSAPAGPTMGAFGPGDYFLMLDSGRVVAVSPATKTYLDGFSTAMGSMPPDMMAQASVTNVVVNVEKLGAGDAVEGHPTDKYRISSQYTMGIMGQSINFASEYEILTAQLPVHIITPFSGSLPKTLATGPFADLYTKISEAQKKVSGTTVRVSSSTGISGPMSMTMTQNVQLSDLKTADVDDKVFQVPEGFTAKPPST
jgi:hypothetical protein